MTIAYKLDGEKKKENSIMCWFAWTEANASPSKGIKKTASKERLGVTVKEKATTWFEKVLYPEYDEKIYLKKKLDPRSSLNLTPLVSWQKEFE